MCSVHESCSFINTVDVDGCTKWSETDYKNKWFLSNTGYGSCALGHPSCFMQLCLGIKLNRCQFTGLGVSFFWSVQIHNSSLYVHNRLNQGALSSGLIHRHWPSMTIQNALYLLMKKHRFGTMWKDVEWMSLFMYWSPFSLALFSQRSQFSPEKSLNLSICLNT